MNKFLVIGSNSFTGASFIKKLLDAGEEVRGISRSLEASNCFLPYKWNRSELQKSSYSFSQLDLNKDMDGISDLLREFKPHYVINFAAQSMVAESWLNPDHWYETNVTGNVRLHEQLRKLDSLEKYVHISTPEVYGNCEGSVQENHVFNPSTPYAASRAACELHLQTYMKQYQFPVVFTRAANVYGPGQQLYRIIPRTILSIKLGEKLKLHGGGKSIRSFIHAQDVAEGTYKAALQGPIGEAYHFSTERIVSIRELVEMICVRLNTPFDEIVEVSPERPGKDNAYKLDATKARTTLEWDDSISLEDGIEDTVQWVEKNLEYMKNESFEYIHKQ